MPIRRNIGGYITANPIAPTQQAATGVWGLVQQLQASAASIWPFVRDPDFDYVSLLLPGNGTNGAQNNTFLDSSANNFTVTRNGDTTQGSFSPYGDLWSNYFDGTGDYLSVGSGSSAIEFTGAFTVECWFYLPTNLTYIGSFSNYVGRLISGSSSGAMELLLGSASSGTAVPTSITVNPYAGSGPAPLLASGLSIPLGTWHHVAVSRDTSNLMSIFFNGARVASGSRSGTYSASTPVIGSLASGSYTGALTGYVSNIRVVKGTAVYDPTQTTITPPTAPLTAITNTSLLTCQSNRFRDASTNNFAITPNGDVRVTNFAPFNPSAAYDPAVNGGSGYFDGTGDYLSVPDNAALDLSGDFTIECWVMWIKRSGSAYPRVVSKGDYQLAAGAWSIVMVESNGNIVFDYGNPSVSISIGTLTAGVWAHIAVSRSGTTLRTFMNGSLTSTATVSQDFSSTYTVRVGAGTDARTNEIFAGYISNLRIVKGTAVYTSGFTPPTAPVAAITNTSLLLNFTNAGIVDASAKNDLVTVGNAQISTAQSKFGGSSIAFDGSGDYLIAPASPNYSFGTGDFTVECWFYRNTATVAANIVGVWTGTASTSSWLMTQGGTNTANLRFGTSDGTTATFYESPATALSNNTWIHVAVTRKNGTLYMFSNGTLLSTHSVPANLSILGPLAVGAVADGSFASNGYIDDLRITKGVARYTANFTPPTAPFPLG